MLRRSGLPRCSPEFPQLVEHWLPAPSATSRQIFVLVRDLTVRNDHTSLDCAFRSLFACRKAASFQACVVNSWTRRCPLHGPCLTSQRPSPCPYCSQYKRSSPWGWRCTSAEFLNASSFFIGHRNVSVLYVPLFGIGFQAPLSWALLFLWILQFSHGRFVVFFEYLEIDAIAFLSTRGWPWRTLRWCVPLFLGCTFAADVQNDGSRGRRLFSSCRKDAGRTFARVSFKLERAFEVIAHFRDWEHAASVRRRCQSGQLEPLRFEWGARAQGDV